MEIIVVELIIEDIVIPYCIYTEETFQITSLKDKSKFQ